MTETRTPPQKPIIMIPARLASTRLPNKPLADIHGAPMIVHVWRRAMESGVAPVVVACDHEPVAEAVRCAGGQAVMTRPDHPSGSDRIWEALHTIEGHAAYDAIINVQGDLPTIEVEAIRAAYDLLKNPAVDIGTLVVPIHDEADKTKRQIVKAIFDCAAGASGGRAYYFTRNPAPSGEGDMYHHVGLYAYRRDALQAFVRAPPSPLELREKLEQLRALALGLRIDVGIIDAMPLGVDTPEDLEKARLLLAKGLPQ